MGIIISNPSSAQIVSSLDSLKLEFIRKTEIAHQRLGNILLSRDSIYKSESLEDFKDLYGWIEYFEYNVSGAYVGEQTPIWCYDNF